MSTWNDEWFDLEQRFLKLARHIDPDISNVKEADRLLTAMDAYEGQLLKVSLDFIKFADMKCEYDFEKVCVTKRDADGFSDYEYVTTFFEFLDWNSESGIIYRRPEKGYDTPDVYYENVDFVNGCVDESNLQPNVGTDL